MNEGSVEASARRRGDAGYGRTVGVGKQVVRAKAVLEPGAAGEGGMGLIEETCRELKTCRNKAEQAPSTPNNKD